MKKIIQLSFALLLSFAFLSCNKEDDKKEDTLSNAFTYDGKTYELKGGFITDYGSAGTHYNYDFYLLDRTYFPDIQEADVKHYIYLELFSNGSNSFNNGMFDFIDGINGDATGKNFFYNAALIFPETSVEIEATSGTVTVAKSGNIWTITADLDFPNNKKVMVNYVGELPIEDDGDARKIKIKK